MNTLNDAALPDQDFVTMLLILCIYGGAMLLILCIAAAIAESRWFRRACNYCKRLQRKLQESGDEHGITQEDPHTDPYATGYTPGGICRICYGFNPNCPICGGRRVLNEDIIEKASPADIEVYMQWLREDRS